MHRQIRTHLSLPLATYYFSDSKTSGCPCEKDESSSSSLSDADEEEDMVVGMMVPTEKRCQSTKIYTETRTILRKDLRVCISILEGYVFPNLGTLFLKWPRLKKMSRV
jgi:hypothetical protein